MLQAGLTVLTCVMKWLMGAPLCPSVALLDGHFQPVHVSAIYCCIQLTQHLQHQSLYHVGPQLMTDSMASQKL